MSASSPRIASLELMRVISMLAVIAIHTSLFISYPIIDGQAWLANIVNQLSRFAVPFFFLLSGFLIQEKLCKNPLLTLINYNKPLLKVWILWSIVCLLLPANLHTLMTEGYLAERQTQWSVLLSTPLNSFLEGGLVHLWFLPALMIAVTTMAYFVRFNVLYLLLPVSIVLYLYGVLAGSYAPLTEISSLFMTRNGPFFSLLMVTIGFEIKRKQISLTPTLAIILLVIGMLGHFIEAYWLFSQQVPFSSHDFLFFTPFWAIGLFLFLLNKPKLGDHALTYYLSKRVLPIYLCHLSVAIVFYNIVGMFSISGLPRDALLFFGTVVCSAAFVIFIEKTPLNKVLFR